MAVLAGTGLFYSRGPDMSPSRHLLRPLLSASEDPASGAINAPSALGALRAVEEAGRAESCAVMGQTGSLEVRAELGKPATRLIGSVAYFPELYGDALIPLSIDILQRKAVPPAVFVKHQMLTRDNVDRLYPNDILLS